MTREKIKKLIDRYPYLLPRSLWTDKVPEDYDYTYIRGIGEIPIGWDKLFLQLCEDIRQPLIDSGCIDTFRFTEIKEKYNTLNCYTINAPKEVKEIIHKYERMARYVCIRCGQPATCETQDGWLASYCDNCWKDEVRHEDIKWLKFEPYYTVNIYEKNNEREEIVSFEDEWNRYLKTIRG